MARGSSTTVTSSSPSRRRSASGKIIKHRFYRAGGIDKVTDYGIAESYYHQADRQKPEGRCGRKEGLFVVASLGEVAQWIKGNSNRVERVLLSNKNRAILCEFECRTFL